MRRVVMIVAAAVALAACPSRTATSSLRTVPVTAWHPVYGYVVDLCATGAWTASQAEAAVFASPAAARDALIAADMVPEHFELHEAP